MPEILDYGKSSKQSRDTISVTFVIAMVVTGLTLALDFLAVNELRRSSMTQVGTILGLIASHIVALVTVALALVMTARLSLILVAAFHLAAILLALMLS